jgi:acyl-CoA reductase-like NAD-dependent aldehyde dehydrogenase
VIGATTYETIHGVAENRLPLHSAETLVQVPARPAVGEQLNESICSQLEIARTAQVQWAAWSMRDRLKVLRKLRLKISSDPRAFAGTVSRENIAETMAAEILPMLDACRYLETQAARILRETAIGKRGRPVWLWGNSVILRSEPLGVVLIIGPANYPLMLPGIQALQAIAAGNAVLIKPAGDCSQCMHEFISLAKSAGLPGGLIQVLPECPEAATLAIRQGVDKAFLTGSASTGRAVSRELAELTTPSVMELSGCDAVFVLDDADANLVSDCLLFGLSLNNSQTCMAPRRVFASNRQADEVLRLLKAKLKSRITTSSCEPNGSVAKVISHLSSGNSKDGHCSPITRQASTAMASAAIQHIHAAIEDGADLVFGSLTNNSPPEHSLAFILDNVNSGMSLAQSDIFAPVLSFIRIESDRVALEENAKCPYALSATVFGSPGRCLQFARRIKAGCVVINDMIVPTADPRVPFGGRGMSGHGKTRGETGLLEMTQLKAIVASRRWFKPHLHSPTPADADVLQQLIQLEHAPNPARSLLAVPKMIMATMEQMRFRRDHRA